MQLMQPSEYVSEYILTRVHKKSFVLVEGKTDRALWTEYAADECHLRPAQGKDIIIDVLNTPFLRGAQGIAGIVDLDYWLVTDADELGTENLLYDDRCPDAESILLCSPALNKVLRHTVDVKDIKELPAFAAILNREAQGLAMEFGYFRLLNHLKDYGLKCNSIRFGEVVDSDRLELDRELVASKLTGDKPGLTSDDLLQEVDALKAIYSPDDARLCRGKDVISIMVFILPILFKDKFGDELSEVALMRLNDMGLSRDLRMAYEFGYFRRTSLFDCIRSWESANSPYRILKPQP